MEFRINKRALTAVMTLLAVLVLLPFGVYAEDTLTVSFSPGEGSGEMEDVELTIDSTYVLPECTFTAPEGKEFDNWYVTKESPIASTI